MKPGQTYVKQFELTKVREAMDNEMLTSSCMLIAIVMNELLKANAASGKRHAVGHLAVVKKLFDKKMYPTKSYEDAVTVLEDLCNSFKVGPMGEKGPYELSDLSTLIDQNKWQVHIFKFNTAGNVTIPESYPKQYDQTLEQIYLLETPPADKRKSGHIGLIVNIKRFFNKHGTYCWVCNKIQTSLYYGHDCKLGQTCSFCRRPFQEQNVPVGYNMEKFYCNSKISSKDLEHECPVCKFSTNSLECLANHRGNGCRRNIKCNQCNRRISLTGVMKNRTQNIAKHKCEETSCHTCHEKVGRHHIHDCKWRKVEAQKIHPKLSFITLSFSKKTEYSERFKALSVEQDVNSACLYLLDGKRYKKVFVNDWDNEFLIEDTKHTKDYLTGVHCEPATSHIPKKLDKIDNILVPSQENDKPIYNLLEIIFNEKKYETFNTTFLVPTKKDLLYIARGVARTSFSSVVPSMNGGNIISIYIQERRITFLALESYLNESFHNILRRHRTPEDELFFPFGYGDLVKGKPKYLRHSLSIKDYYDIDDRYKLQQEKEIYAKYKLGKKHEFDFREELKKFMDFSTVALMKAANTFFRTLTSLETYCQKDTKKEFLPNEFSKIFPFTASTPTSASVNFYLYRLYYGNYEDLRAVRYENFGVPVRKASQPETEFVQWLQYNNPNIISAFVDDGITGFKGKAYPDAFDTLTKTSYYLHGCKHHLHNPLICKHKKLNWHNKIEIMKKTELDFHLKESREKREDDLNTIHKFNKENPSLIVDFKEYFECEWEEMKENNPEINEFIKGPHFFNFKVMDRRLAPRDALKGGFCETYRFGWSKHDNEYVKFHYVDINGLYPYVAKENCFPVGPATRILGPSLKFLKLNSEGKLFLNSTQIFGLCNVKVTAPKHLDKPFLIYKPRNHTKSYLVLCKECIVTADNEGKVLRNNLKVCKHSNDQRSWVGTYTTHEIEKATKLGYKFDFFEIYHYSNQKPIFKKFVNLLCSEKLKASGFPDNLEKEMQQEYCEYINKHMNFQDQLQLTLKNVEYNESKKGFFKYLLNTLFGKFAQNKTNIRTDRITDEKEIKIIKDKNHDILDVEVLTFKDCLITYDTGIATQINLNSCSVIFSMITALGRIEIYENMEKLENLGALIFYVSVDAIGCASRKEMKLPPNFLGYSYGQFKNEHDNVIAFYCLAPRNYCVVKLDKDGNELSVFKICGLKMTIDVYDSLDVEKYKMLVHNFLANIYEEVMLKVHWKTQNVHSGVITTITRRKLANDIYQNRKIEFDEHGEFTKSVPYGYVEM